MVTENGLAKVAGRENVSGDAATLEAYAGDLSFVGRVRPQFVVKVGDLQTVQELVALAKETNTPLSP